VLRRKSRRTSEKHESQSLEGVFVDRLDYRRLSAHLCQTARSYFLVYKPDFTRGETALIEPLLQIFAA
jgi:hypothetical protein